MSTRQQQPYRTFDQPDTHEEFEHGILDLVAIEDREVGRVTLSNGWRLSESGIDMRQPHVVVIVKGSLYIQDETGQESHAETGSVVSLREGYDAWTRGVCELLDLTDGAREFAGSR